MGSNQLKKMRAEQFNKQRDEEAIKQSNPPRKLSKKAVFALGAAMCFAAQSDLLSRHGGSGK
ncbi:MAG: hypothetical protein ACRC8W_01130 [Plesiomonas shigelloides]